MKMTSQSLMIFFIMIFSAVHAAAGENNVAVLDFHAKDVPGKQASIITDIVRGAIVKSGKYNVLDRANMDSILREQSFQQTGCTEAACAVKIGKLLSMQYMIVGTMSKLGSTYILSIELISVESGKIIKSEDGNSRSIDDMIGVAKDAANRLVGIASAAAFTQTPVSQTALAAGTIVFAEWRPNDWYHGKVTGDCGQGFHILYDDGDKKCCSLAQIAVDNIPRIDSVRVNTRVLARWSNGKYYPGIVSEINDNIYSIQFDDGDKGTVKLEHIRLLAVGN